VTNKVHLAAFLAVTALGIAVATAAAVLRALVLFDETLTPIDEIPWDDESWD
jgi:hypothetical protein